MGYDLQKDKVVFQIANKEPKVTLNTINSLQFHKDTHTFLSATRDGYIKLYDMRTNIQESIVQVS